MKRNDTNILEQTGDVHEPGKSEEEILKEGKKKNFTELQKFNIEAEAYSNNKKCN